MIVRLYDRKKLELMYHILSRAIHDRAEEDSPAQKQIIQWYKQIEEQIYLEGGHTGSLEGMK